MRTANTQWGRLDRNKSGRLVVSAVGMALCLALVLTAGSGEKASGASGGLSVPAVGMTKQGRVERLGGVTGVAYAVAVDGSTAYVGSSDGLYAINVSNPANPQVANYFATPAPVTGVALAGGKAYVTWGTSGYGGMSVVNLGTFLGVATVGPASVPALDVVVSGSYAYVALGGTDLESGNWLAEVDVINISGATPQVLGYYLTEGWPHRLALAKNRVFVALERYDAWDDFYYGAVELINATTPTAP